MEESIFCTAIFERIERPIGLPNSKFNEYKKTVLQQVQNLERDGWDQVALLVYIDQLNRQKNTNIKKQTKRPINDYLDVFFVGSDSYTEMFITSQLSKKEKVMLVIRHLGGYLDDEGDLQLSTEARYKFHPQMSPGAVFLDIYSKTVQQAYPNGLIVAKKDKKLSKIAIKKKYADETKIHQFRHQLDKHNIEYVEAYKKRFGLKNDEEAIKMILKDHWFYADPQYHNRAQIGIDILDTDLDKGKRTLTNKGLFKKVRKEGFYRKILSGDYHSEFIIDEQGQLLSQWTKSIRTNEYWESTITNGESFNYGERPRFDQYYTHDKLDGVPPRYFDTNKRNELKQSWIAPTDNWFYQLLRRMSEKGLRYKRK
ncbi:DUF3114 domain-containing protein [Enterococcus quebecensis]|uniref:DUF3114 domain-containing protein n=1 Tax=Enterococcus quebecensis TaxID=903983 RepID=UPI0009F3D9D0|nr:DUF3114 domain-containing protein [Enterococcus quebecensis]